MHTTAPRSDRGFTTTSDGRARLAIFDRFATAIAIITFRHVAMLPNTQSHADKAVQQKLNAIAHALADFMGVLSTDHPELNRHREELTAAVSLEKQESS
ncbi:hypothetical protein JMUB6875_03050 [Nocardia sp. JMUB6875]|uniref:hypothetical protein n=1 Tax=Nocardia sp. JMUB6875 TaxID=3158170 RepID=UPI0032E6336D